MLSENAKEIIKEAVKSIYRKNHTGDKVDFEIDKRVDNFSRFLKVYKDDEKYGNDLKDIIEELEAVASMSPKRLLYLSKICKIEAVIGIVVREKNIKIDENLSTIEAYKNLKLMENNETYLKAFEVFESGRIEAQEKAGGNIRNAEYWDSVPYIFNMYIEVTNRLYALVMDKCIDIKINVEQYLENIKEKYERKINFQYIPATVFKIAGSNDYFSDETEDYDERISFIDINKKLDLNKIKLIGYAGVGKSTTLEYIEYEDAINFSKNKKIPVLINLIAVEEKIEIAQLINKILNLENDQDGILDYLIKNNRINLYFDGVNEIGIKEYNEKRKFLDDLDKFITSEKLKNVKIIVTDRDNNAVSVLNNVNTYLIQGMAEEDIEAFIEGNTQLDKIEEVKKAILENNKLSDKPIHPIMLKSLITIIECGEEVPTKISQLREEYLKAIINREISSKKSEIAKHIDGCLKYLVKSFREKSVGAMSSFKILNVFNEYANEKGIDFPTDELLTLMTEMGILKLVEFEKYAFADEEYYHIYNRKLD